MHLKLLTKHFKYTYKHQKIRNIPNGMNIQKPKTHKKKPPEHPNHDLSLGTAKDF